MQFWLTLSLLNYNVIKCLSAEIIYIYFFKVITDVAKGAIRGLPGGLLFEPPAVKGLMRTSVYAQFVFSRFGIMHIYLISITGIFFVSLFFL